MGEVYNIAANFEIAVIQLAKELVKMVISFSPSAHGCIPPGILSLLEKQHLHSVHTFNELYCNYNCNYFPGEECF